ncbi:helix-turn-helix transcriptional regulator [Rhodococcus sp. WB9]|uniref:helix-turn-helix transcriptional regulator n=1 Tax=Rhodococcus sp. WB9 TaxID=2594007 RepID=UPI0028C3E577|nr:helix-turn-helix transcriptional regulator [Rhodococcus sp. WB9]
MNQPADGGLAPLFDLAVRRGDSQAAAELAAQSGEDSLTLEWTRQALLSHLRSGLRDAGEIRNAAEFLQEIEVIQRRRQARRIADHRSQLTGFRAFLTNLRGVSRAERPYVVTDRLCRDLGFRKSVYSPATTSGWSPTTIAIHPELEDSFAPLRRAVAALSLPPGAAPREEEVFRSGRGIAVDPIDIYRNTYRPLVELSRPRGYLAVPVVAAGRVTALLHADHDDAEVDESDMITLQTAAAVCALTAEQETLRSAITTRGHRVTEQMTAILSALAELEQSQLSLTEALGTEADRPGCASGAVGISHCAALTVREHEVFEFVAHGTPNADIAGALFVSEGTVKSHVQRIYRKLGVATRAEAAVLYRTLHRPGQETCRGSHDRQ